ncbi:MAG: hypothetical protein Q8L86_07870 [Vicinamibacterales bacterium]|nr:hypothetical protein [Vicinamibacterales bacterium]
MTRIACWLSLGCVLLFAPPALAQESVGDGQPPVQARPGGPDDSPSSDETVDVARGTRLVMSNNAGEVHVRTWDRDAVRVEAVHGPRERIEVQVAEMTVRVRARTERGPQGLIDYRLTVPRWMPVNLSGTYLEATVEGTGAEVTIETVRGSARVRGGSGTISVRSVQGTVSVEGASGRVTASSVNEDIHLADLSGDVSAESTNGNVFLRGIKSSIVDVSTVNGHVAFEGGVQDKGAYRITTHNGDIRVGLGGAANTTVFVRTFRGRFGADFPVTLPEGQAGNRGSMRFNFTLGSGSARIELQSFGGNIFIARNALPTDDRRQRGRGLTPPALPTPPAPPRPPGDDWDHGDWTEADWDGAWDRAWDLTWNHVDPHGWSAEEIGASVEAAIAGADIDATIAAAVAGANIDATIEAALAGAGISATIGAALTGVNVGATIDAALAGINLDAVLEAALDAVVVPTPRVRTPR